MSRQINLLAHDAPQAPLTAERALIVLGALFALMLAYGTYAWTATSRLADTVVQNDAVIAAEKARQNALLQQLNAGSALESVADEIKALSPQAAQSQAVLNLLRGETGTGNDGYSDYLTLLARTPSEGLWLTSVKISNAGKTVSLAGHSLQKDTVLGYAQRLNEQFAKYGVRFTGLELAPESGQEGTAKTALTSVIFKLN